MGFPPDDETLAFREDLERLYRDHFLRGVTTDHVDRVGQVVHTQRYTAERLKGRSHADAGRLVLRQAYRDDPATQGVEMPDWLGGGESGASWRPSRAAVDQVTGDFLDALGGFQRPTFMGPGMSRAEQETLIQYYPGSHLLAGWSTVYPRFPQWSFDFSADFGGYEGWLDRCFARERIPVVVIPIAAGDRVERHLTRIRQYLDRLQAAGRLVCLMWGWEINDISDELADGDGQLAYLEGLARLVDGDLPIALHWTPERWSGWPSFQQTIGRTEDEGDELAWLRQAVRVAGPRLRMWYQSPWDTPIEGVLERVYTLDRKNYDGPGICGRSLTAGIPFVHLEHSRSRSRFEVLRQAAIADGRGGYC